jgi:hypothetical protein
VDSTAQPRPRRRIERALIWINYQRRENSPV